MATLADLPLGARILIPVGTDENRLCEIADKDNLVSDGTVLVYKNAYEESKFGNSTLYPDGTLDNLIKNTIFNSFPQTLREKMIDVTFTLESSVSITRKMFALTYTMAGFGNNSGLAEGKALQLYTSNASRVKTFNGSAAFWWLSSQRSSDVAWDVNADGSADYDYPSYSSDVVPAFAIPQSMMLEDSANEDGSYYIKYTEKISCTINMGSAEEQPKAALPIISCNGNLTLKICNNANDANPAWETAANETVHNFANTVKTAAQWAIGLKIDITRTAGESLFLNKPVVLAMK